MPDTPPARPAAGHGETLLFRIACALLFAHALADAVLGLNPGVSAGDHWLRVLAIGVVLLAAALALQRTRPGLQGALALSLSLFAAVAAAVAVVLAGVEGFEPATVTGVLLIPVAALLLAIGVRVLWRSRRPDGRTYLRRALIGLLSIILAYEIVLPIGFAWVATHRPAEEPGAPDLGRTYETVAVATADGLELSGWYVPSENGAAVITFPSREGTDEHAAMLAENGFGVLALDARGYGDSDGDPNAFGWEGATDIAAGVEYLQGRPDVANDAIGGLGLSVGGEDMLEAAAETVALRAVVSEGAGERSVRETLLFGPAAALTIPQQAVLTAAVGIFSGSAPPPALDDVTAAIAPRAVFLVRGGEGQPGEELNEDYFEAAGEPKEIWTVPGAGHTGGLDAEPEEYEERVVGFFERFLGRR